MFRNVCYLVLGVVLGAILGFLVCDNTKKRILKAIQNRAKQLSGCVQSSSEKAADAINTVKNAVKGLS
ncbi:MAG: hypothetical protein V3581_01590 [Candidatus Cardinium sp.]|uniref:hypothetical protein n=1 Tax=unclassified Candidatus Cardinium TaxID=2641185 RepID=UPI000E0D95F0|nr:MULTISPECIES: hypothetical protein [unclassified Candidatus Cardinium]AXI23951.1 hypothetical protein CE557_109 [Cardinium endosymbiont of Sogatella furcifera]MCT4697493.1 hypothetical protein [Candidatus Cardinium sp. TP]MDN5247410.1 hypothetical protein [Candidatus Cardinium sp.]